MPSWDAVQARLCLPVCLNSWVLLSPSFSLNPHLSFFLSFSFIVSFSPSFYLCIFLSFVFCVCLMTVFFKLMSVGNPLILSVRHCCASSACYRTKVTQEGAHLHLALCC